MPYANTFTLGTQRITSSTNIKEHISPPLKTYTLLNPKCKYQYRCRTYIKSITSNSIITTQPKTSPTTTKCIFWKPSSKTPYHLINTLAHNNHLSLKDLEIIASGLTSGSLIGATDGTEKKGLQAGGWISTTRGPINS